jgi:predicted acyltransferase
MTDSSPNMARIVSLDQFRGYTVLGMFLVNFVGSFAAVRAVWPLLCHYNTYCSYADTIMPQFFFAVGFAYRLTFLRRHARAGGRAAYLHVVQRNLGLLLLAFVVYHLDGVYSSWHELRQLGIGGFLQRSFQRELFQTLTHIALASLWIAPVIAARPAWRVAFAIFSAVAFHLLSEAGYYTWVMERPGIDGGPLGFLAWTVPLLTGTLAYDVVATAGSRTPRKLLLLALLLMAVGYGLSCVNRLTEPNVLPAAGDWRLALVEPPFVPPTRPVNIWTMSQRAGSVSYMTFSAGFSLALYALFVLACDQGSLQIGLLRTLGTNALAGYLLHELVNNAIRPLVPKDSPLLYVLLAFGLSLGICYLFLRHLEKHRLFLRL